MDSSPFIVCRVWIRALEFSIRVTVMVEVDAMFEGRTRLSWWRCHELGDTSEECWTVGSCPSYVCEMMKGKQYFFLPQVVEELNWVCSGTLEKEKRWKRKIGKEQALRLERE